MIRYCPYCGNKTKHYYKYCPICGEYIKPANLNAKQNKIKPIDLGEGRNIRYLVQIGGEQEVHEHFDVYLILDSEYFYIKREFLYASVFYLPKEVSNSAVDVFVKLAITKNKKYAVVDEIWRDGTGDIIDRGPDDSSIQKIAKNSLPDLLYKSLWRERLFTPIKK